MRAMTERRIPVAGPWITEKEIDYVSDAVATNWYQRRVSTSSASSRHSARPPAARSP